MDETSSDGSVVTPVATNAAPLGNTAARYEEDSAPAPDHSRFYDLKQQLQTLRQRAQAAGKLISEYLHRLRHSGEESSKSEEAVNDLTKTLKEINLHQDSLESLLLESFPEGGPSIIAGSSWSECDSMPAWAIQFQSAVLDRLTGIEAQLQTQMDRLETKTATSDQSGRDGELASRKRDDDSDAIVLLRSPAVLLDESGQAWLHALLGSELCADERLTASVNWLESGVLANNPDALFLIGQLLVFRFTNSDRKPPLLKEVGEAFYRCFPKTCDDQNLFEETLAEWLRRQCDAAGLPNTIELVHPGERYDPNKHAPVERGGVEIVSVLGWVVLRDGGRVFSKAAVQTC